MFSSPRVICYDPIFLKNNQKSKTKYTNFKLRQFNDEMNFVKMRLILITQKRSIVQNINLYAILKIPNKSSVKTLNPFLDSNSVLRANGRLAQSSLSCNECYPIVLPGNSRLCHLYLSHLHIFLVHAECSKMCRIVQTEFFIFRLKPRVKNKIPDTLHYS